MELILAEKQQLPIVRDIAHLTWPKAYHNILSSEQMNYMLDLMYSMKALEQQMELLGHRFILAKQADEFCGFVSFETNYRSLVLTKIHKIYVVPESQGKHTGQALIEATAAAALERKNRSLTLNVNRYNLAVGFYKKIGFSITGTEDIDIGKGYLMEDFIMDKEIGQ